MIEIYTGAIGSGKSLSAVHRGCEYAAQGGVVVSNIDFLAEGMSAYCKHRWGWEVGADQVLTLDDEQVPRFHELVPHGTTEKPTLCIIDEAHLWFNSRDWAKQPRDLLNWLTLSRRAAVDVIFITQAADNLDKQFRRLAQSYYGHRNLATYHVPGIGKIPFVKYVLQVQYDMDGRGVLGRRYVALEKRLFGCYNTLQMVRHLPKVEKGALKSNNALSGGKGGKAKKSGAAKIILFVAIALVGGIFHVFNKWKSDFGGDEAIAIASDLRADPSEIEPREEAPFSGRNLQAVMVVGGVTRVTIDGERYGLGDLLPCGYSLAGWSETGALLFAKGEDLKGVYP